MHAVREREQKKADPEAGSVNDNQAENESGHDSRNESSKDAGKQADNEIGIETVYDEGEQDDMVTKGDGTSPRSGEVVAGMLAALLGMAALTAAHWWSAADPATANLFLIRLSSWLPGGLRIGPYGGKEITALAVWLGSWLILFITLRWFELRLRFWTVFFAIGMMILLVLLWPPVYHKIYGWPT